MTTLGSGSAETLDETTALGLEAYDCRFTKKKVFLKQKLIKFLQSQRQGDKCDKDFPHGGWEMHTATTARPQKSPGLLNTKNGDVQS